MTGTFEDFLAALLAFTSGWDRERYNAGGLEDRQLDQSAGGSVSSFFPSYSSWSELSPAEWKAMACRSVNSLGFVGFRFGEALMIDLGYYDAEVYYGHGSAINRWDGTWTGKNGIHSLKGFMSATAQRRAICEAFGHYLRIMQSQLAASGSSLEAVLGRTVRYTRGEEVVQVELTLSGILAAAHLRGAWGTASLLLGGAASMDQYGASILQSLDQFGGYDSPSITQLTTLFEDRSAAAAVPAVPETASRKTPDPQVSPEDMASDETASAEMAVARAASEVAPEALREVLPGYGAAGVSAETATVVISWAWRQSDRVTGFNPATDTIFIDKVGALDLDVAETTDGVVFSIPSNAQSTTLAGVRLNELSGANFTILDASAAEGILALVGGNARAPLTATQVSRPRTPLDPVAAEPLPADPLPAVPGQAAAPKSGALAAAAPVPDEVANRSGEAAPVLVPSAEVPQDDVLETVLDASAAGPDETGTGHGTAGVTAASATVVITRARGDKRAVSGFNPQAHSIFIDSFEPEAIEVFEEAGHVVFAMPSNNQALALEGVFLRDLSPANFTILNAETGRKLLSKIEAAPRERAVGRVSEDNGAMEPGSPVAAEPAPLGAAAPVEAGAAAQVPPAVRPAFAVFEPISGKVRQSASSVPTVEVDDVFEPDMPGAPRSAQPLPESPVPEVTLPDMSLPNVPLPLGGSARGGVKWGADFRAENIIGFDPGADEIDFSMATAEGFVLTMSPAGEPVINNPTGPEHQIVQDIRLSDLSLDAFVGVGSKLLRQDLGAILCWEKGIGPRSAGTVYIRSHECGVSDVVAGFDPATWKISFLYFGARDHLSVEDTADGLVIACGLSGQKVIFPGVLKAALRRNALEFRHDQLLEDTLVSAFGATREEVALVTRSSSAARSGPVAASETDGVSSAPLPPVAGREAIEVPVLNTSPADRPNPGAAPHDRSMETLLSEGDAEDSGIVLTRDKDEAFEDRHWGWMFDARSFNPEDDILNFRGSEDAGPKERKRDDDLKITVNNQAARLYRRKPRKTDSLPSDKLKAANWKPVVIENNGAPERPVL